MADLDPEVLKQTNDLLNSINATLSSIPDRIASVNNVLGDAGQQVENTKKSVDSASRATDRFARSAENAGIVTEKAMERAKQKINDIYNSTTQAALGMDGISQSADRETLSLKAEKMSQALSAISVAALGARNNLSGFGKEVESVGNITAEVANRDFERFTKSLSLIGAVPGLSKLATAIEGVVSKVGELYKSSNNLRILENDLIGVRAAFGGFEDAGSRLEFIENMPREIARYNDTILGISTSMNVATDETKRYASELMRIPGAYDSIIEAGDGSGRSIKLLEASMRIARGTTGNFNDVLQATTLEFRQFGTAGDSSLDTVSRMYEMSQSLGVSFEDFSGSVNKIIEGFSSLGNTSQSATELVAGLGRSLMNTGIGIGPTKRIIDSITGSMEGLGIAQKAFLSQQTGGAGGLQGAFQIDQLIAQGNIRGVYEKMEQALRQQFGGNIVGLEEGAQDQNAAAQLTKQIQFLRQGPFGQVVQSDQDAYKLLEAFKRGAGPDQELLDRGRGALEGAATADTAIQEKQRDAIVALSNTTKQLLDEAQIQTGLMARSIVGEGNMATLLSQIEEASRQRSVRAGAGTGRQTTGRGAERRRLEDDFQYQGPEKRVLGLATDLEQLIRGKDYDIPQLAIGPGTQGLAGAVKDRAIKDGSFNSTRITPPPAREGEQAQTVQNQIVIPGQQSGPSEVTLKDGTYIEIVETRQDGTTVKKGAVFRNGPNKATGGKSAPSP